MYNLGIIGAGLIGNKRARNCKGAKLVAVTDLNVDLAEKLAKENNCAREESWQSLLKREDINLVIIATSNNVLAEIACAAIESGKHVLLEKPAGRNPAELQKIINAKAANPELIVAVGFNHRFHDAFLKAKSLMSEIGPLMHIRARYGHGGRLGYEKEWRANPELSGGGELLDQGVHLIDLCRWLGGEFELEYGDARTSFWDMPVDDNAFLHLKSPDKKSSAWLHASCTEWKNLFDFEVFGSISKLQIWGLGRSYGKEELRYFKMKPEMGPPDIFVDTFPTEDLSWQKEFSAWLDAIESKNSEIATIEDAKKAVDIVYEVYRNSGYKWAQA